MPLVPLVPDRGSYSSIRGIETALYGVHVLILIKVSFLSGFLEATWSFCLMMSF